METPRNTRRFQGIQENTKGAQSREEWCANVRRDSQEYNEIPRTTKELYQHVLQDMPFLPQEYKSCQTRRQVCEWWCKRYAKLYQHVCARTYLKNTTDGCGSLKKHGQFTELCAQTALSPSEYRPFTGRPKKHQLRPRSKTLAMTKQIAHENLIEI